MTLHEALRPICPVCDERIGSDAGCGFCRALDGRPDDEFARIADALIQGVEDIIDAGQLGKLVDLFVRVADGGGVERYGFAKATGELAEFAPGLAGKRLADELNENGPIDGPTKWGLVGHVIGAFFFAALGTGVALSSAVNGQIGSPMAGALFGEALGRASKVVELVVQRAGRTRLSPSESAVARRRFWRQVQLITIEARMREQNVRITELEAWFTKNANGIAAAESTSGSRWPSRKRGDAKEFLRIEVEPRRNERDEPRTRFNRDVEVRRGLQGLLAIDDEKLGRPSIPHLPSIPLRPSDRPTPDIGTGLT